MNKVGKIVTLWGLAVFLGWILSAAVQLNFFGTGYVTSALILWSGLMATALVLTYWQFPNAAQNRVVHVWTAIVVGGMLINFANYYRLLPATLAPYVYLHGWVLLTAIGFALTALWWTPKSKMVYAAGAALNVVLLALLLAKVPQAMPYGVWLAAIVGGVPIILDGVMNYNIAKPLAPQSPAPQPMMPAPSVPSAPVTPTASRTSAPASSGPRKLVVKIVPKK